MLEDNAQPKTREIHRPLPKLMIASFSTRLALLNDRIPQARADTFSTRMASWREKGLTDTFIWTVANTLGGDSPKTGLDMLKFLTDGSPALRLAFQLLKEWWILEPLTEKIASHQKMIIAVSMPVFAWFLEVVFQTALIGTAVFHSGLTHQQRIELTKAFNDRTSSLKVLIMTYDVEAVGLNLHEACNRVLILDPAISRAAESQLAGRALKVRYLFLKSESKLLTKFVGDFPLSFVDHAMQRCELSLFVSHLATSTEGQLTTGSECTGQEHQRPNASRAESATDPS